jgi:hypothetical protein
MVECFQAMTAHPVTPLVRVPWNEPGIIGKHLDGGAWGIICPMVNNKAEAQALARRACIRRPASAAMVRSAPRNIRAGGRSQEGQCTRPHCPACDSRPRRRGHRMRRDSFVIAGLGLLTLNPSFPLLKYTNHYKETITSCSGLQLLATMRLPAVRMPDAAPGSASPGH